MSGSKVEKCPRCGGEIERGHISFGTEVRWRGEKR